MTDIAAGIHAMPESVYHADPCPEPSLSASIAKILWAQSPLHAWTAHPRLNPKFTPINKTAFDLGTACHDVLLEGGTSKLTVIDANDWRTNAAKEARDAAYQKGLTPLLPDQYERVLAMCDAALRYIEQTDLAMVFADGTSEQTMIAQYNGVWLRGRLDRISGDRRIIVDYKTVGQSANPEQFARTALFPQGHDIQAAMYELLNRLTGGPEKTEYRWLVQETDPPYACSLVGASQSVMDMGEQKLMIAMDRWQRCLQSAQWPAYSARAIYPEPPPWEMAKVEQALQEVSK